jgi:hypothetical protein
MNYLGRIANALTITGNVKIIYKDDEELQSIVTSQNTGDEYLVSCVDDLWRCDCHDFFLNGLHKDTGSYFCKHCIAVILYLAK